MITVAIVGVGYWGKNLVRGFHSLKECYLSHCVDVNETRLEQVKKLYPSVHVTQELKTVLEDPLVQGLVIATPANSHFELAREALRAGKHVYLEKPMCLCAAHCQELLALAEEKNLKLMVGHLMKYHPVVERLKELIDRGDLGEVYYIYAQRTNLGIVRKDENALWSFGPHDLSIINYLLDSEPTVVATQGESYLQEGVQDVVFLHLKYGDRKMAQIQLSWLDPHKERKVTVVGSKKMVVFDDTRPAEKLWIYDKGVDKNKAYSSYSDFLSLRNGDIYIPQVKMEEPLTRMCRSFLESIANGQRPFTDGWDGLKVVKTLEAAQLSLDKGGMPVEVTGG